MLKYYQKILKRYRFQLQKATTKGNIYFLFVDPVYSALWYFLFLQIYINENNTTINSP